MDEPNIPPEEAKGYRYDIQQGGAYASIGVGVHVGAEQIRTLQAELRVSIQPEQVVGQFLNSLVYSVTLMPIPIGGTPPPGPRRIPPLGVDDR